MLIWSKVLVCLLRVAIHVSIASPLPPSFALDVLPFAVWKSRAVWQF